MAAASALVVFASIAAFSGIYSSAGHQSAVLIVTGTIEQGQRITATDLGQASVSISKGVDPILVSDAPELSGKRASVTIPAGSLLTLGDITGSPVVPAGDAVVGLALKVGQLPSTGLVAGEQVMVVQTASPGAPVNSAIDSSGTSSGASGAAGDGSTDSDGGDVASTGVLVPQATVFDVEASQPNDADGGTTLISITVASTLAAVLATAAAADQVSVVLLPGAADQTSAAVHGPSAAGSQADASRVATSGSVS
jgi:Chaperone for flagella basal body P-ring formation